MTNQFVDSTALLTQPEQLRARAEQDGYLFFRGLLPAEAISPVREDLLDVVERHGWLRKGGNRSLGRLRVAALSQEPESKMRTDIGVSRDAYHDVQKLESVHRLPHHPHLLNLYRTLFGGEPLVHARHIIRMITPHPAVFPTPPHQDFPLIQGTAQTWTCWFPIGDCPRSLGALKVLRGSQNLGYLPIEPAKGAGAIAAQLCPGESDWVEGDFAMGEVVSLVDQQGEEFARGLTNYDMAAAMSIVGKRTDEIARELGAIPYDEVIHRDNLVVTSLSK